MSIDELRPETSLEDLRVELSATDSPSRRITLGRLRGPVTWSCIAAAGVAAVGFALGTVVAGRLAVRPTGLLVTLLALLVVGGAILDTAGRAGWAGVVDRAEGRLRGDLLSAAMSQPLSALSETAVGEILDRIDDDTHELGMLLRRMAWDLVKTGLRAVPMWIVAGLTWWPAWILFPIAAALTWLVMRRPAAEVSRLKVIEEMAWTDHAAVMEEGIAARDDLRSSLGQAYLIRRCAELSAAVHAKVAATCRAAAVVGRRAGLVLHGLLAATAVAGIALATHDHLSVAELVTLFLVTTSFVGQIDMVARHMPDLQEGLGALTRLRSMMAVPAEPSGGRAVPSGTVALSVRGLRFAYPHGTFELRDIDLEVPAGSTVALVGRTGSGKSTLAALLSRAVEPPPGTVFVGDVDVTTIDLQQLRGAIGVVTQRTELLAGSFADNVTLFADIPRAVVERAIDELGLTSWVAGLPDGLDTVLGPGGTSLSAGEEQLVAFARLLVRDVQVVVLDEATARMDPVTEARVVGAAERLLSGRTGVLIAHRLSTTARADTVAVLSSGRIVQQGDRAALAETPGPFRDLLDAAGVEVDADPLDLEHSVTATARRTGDVPPEEIPGPGPSLARSTVSMLRAHPRWGLGGAGLFLVSATTGAWGAVTGWVWGHLVADLRAGRSVTTLTVALVVVLLVAPIALSAAFAIYPQWWSAVLLRVRQAVLRGQTQQHRLPRTPPGEVVARAMDADRFARYADRWVDFTNGIVIVAVTMVVGWSVLAGLVLVAVMVVSAMASTVGTPIAGRSAAASSTARARFGRSLVSALDAARTVKLAAATPAVHRHLQSVDAGRVNAAVREHRVQAVLDGVPIVMVQCGVVAGWLVYLAGGWGLATALLVTTAVNGFDWFGRVAGSVITEAPGVRAWKDATSRLAGGADLMALPPGVDLVRGDAPTPPLPPRTMLQSLSVVDLTAVHPDGTIGVSDVSFSADAGELVLLLGPVGSGKSSLLAALAGLVHHTGHVRWNGVDVEDPQVFLRPGQVAYVAQVPRVLSGTFADNVRLDHDRSLDRAIADARLSTDITDAGGLNALVGHRGVRLSGGQVQRLAFARALATEAELVLADDVSSALDARTEVELWDALRARGTTVIASTSKQAALRQADRVVVLVDGRVAAFGPWTRLAHDWQHLAG
ncbi:MAG TPA: ABC transporter ATP-binding protein [Mycobacteriales bacterium]|jgi:ABC-type multidrug transport system fused ATPase/permease subunit|nr:ABC transporter ATP-binding protein [Mycobacteriales bacterium]